MNKHSNEQQLGSLNFQLNCQADCVHILRAMVEVLASRVALSDIASNRIALAVDELFANIMCHGYKNKLGRVEFECKIHTNKDADKELHFIFRDYAPVADIGNWECGHSQPCSAETISPGGLGRQLIHSIMDVVEHKALPDGNRWTLIYICKEGRVG